MSKRIQKVNPKLAATKRKEADQLFASAEKALQTGFFKWSPDYEVAASDFQKSALAYQTAGLTDKAVNTYKRAAFCYIQTKTEYSAGKSYEAAAKLENTRKNFATAAALYQKAAENYGNSNNNEKMAEVLVTAAKAWESDNKLKEAASVLEQATNVYEADDREYNGVEAFKKLASIYVEMEEFKSAFEVLNRLIKVFETLEQPHNVHATYFHIIVMLLYTGQGSEANEKLNTFMNSSVDFLQSNEYSMASLLVDATLSDSEELLEKFRKSNMHTVRERTYAKMIMKMKFLGSSSHQLQGITDQLEDQLILGTPPASPRTSEVSEQPQEQPSTNVPMVEETVPEITDDDLL